jgi:hypothetical protein
MIPLCWVEANSANDTLIILLMATFHRSILILTSVVETERERKGTVTFALAEPQPDGVSDRHPTQRANVASNLKTLVAKTKHIPNTRRDKVQYQ